jgi:hypothetical protein
VTQIDGNAVGVAPEGTAGDQGAEVIEASNDDAETAETVVAEVDPAVLDMLADESAPEAVTTTEPEVTADDVPEPTDDEVLAAIDNAKTPRKSGTKAPATVMRDFTAVASIDEATLKANLDGISAKKVREKAENVIAAVQSGKKLSRYTADAVAHLKEQGRVNGKSLADMFQTKGLSLGTARAQSQQMTALFPLIGLATKEDGSKDLVLQDNNLADELVKIAA